MRFRSCAPESNGSTVYSPRCRQAAGPPRPASQPQPPNRHRGSYRSNSGAARIAMTMSSTASFQFLVLLIGRISMAQQTVSWLIGGGSFRIYTINAAGQHEGRIKKIECIDTGESVQGPALKRLMDRLGNSDIVINRRRGGPKQLLQA